MFIEDTRTETFLQSLGVKFSYVDELRFTQLRHNWEKQNIGRSRDVVESAVEEYASLMENHSPAPAPIVYSENGSDGFEVLDGVQRLMAGEMAGSSRFAAYQISKSSTLGTRTKIRVLANVRLQGGHQESNEWSMTRAVERLMLDGDYTEKDVAKWGGWSVHKVRDKFRILEMRRKLRGVGISHEVCEGLARNIALESEDFHFSTSPSTICEFVETLDQCKMTIDEARPYVEEFFNTGSRVTHKKMRSNLQNFMDDEHVSARLSPTGGFMSMTVAGKLVRALKSVETICANAVKNGDSLNGAAEECYRLTRKIESALKRLSKRS